MKQQRRWIRRVIETAKSDSTPMPWAAARARIMANGPALATKRPIRSTLSPKKG